MITVPEKVMAKFIATESFKKKQTVVKQFLNRGSNGGGYYSSFPSAARHFLIEKAMNRLSIDTIIARLQAEAQIAHGKKATDNREVLVRGCREFSQIWHKFQDDQAA